MPFANIERRRACDREYYLAHREQILARKREYRRTHKEQISAYIREHRSIHRERLLEYRREYRRAHAEQRRAQSRKDKPVKRARRAGVYTERIVPSVIFERDGWRCRVCRCKTPKELQGSAAPNAPTPDHIIPLKLGGPHTKANTRCLCRSCNGRKWANYEGQLAFA